MSWNLLDVSVEYRIHKIDLLEWRVINEILNV